MTAPWYWQEGSLKCQLLQGWRHHFFTKAQSLPPGGISAKQVHGNHCLYGADCLDPVKEADSLWLDQNYPGSIWVCSADCVPILIAEPVAGLVAAVHSGWRGTAQAILKNTLATLVAQGGKPAHLLCALGPAISGAMYQVGADVADRVVSTLQTPVGIQKDDLPGHYRLDLRLVQRQQLIEMGIPPHNISIAPYCTYSRPDLFHSYRRSRQNNDGDVGKVQWSGIYSL
jgi:YfiH family protein